MMNAKTNPATTPTVIGLDIDSTVITHCYPKMDGGDLGAIPWLLKAQERFPSVRYMICTMRSGTSLELAVTWLEARGVVVWAQNRNPHQDWTDSPKPHAHIYVEDRAVGVPLKGRDIDWERYGPMFIRRVEMEVAFRG